MFNQHGQVQTCIVNKEKRHAFVKMLTRRDAVAAKEAMENSQYRVSRPRAPVPLHTLRTPLTIHVHPDTLGRWLRPPRLQ